MASSAQARIAQDAESDDVLCHRSGEPRALGSVTARADPVPARGRRIGCGSGRLGLAACSAAVESCYHPAAMGPRVVAIIIAVIASSSLGCGTLISSATTGLAENVSAAVLDQEDPLLVRDGAPAYLIAIDGLIEGDPKNETLLLAGARLYSAYASAFVEDPERASRLTTRALGYGQRALCVRNVALCESAAGSLDDFEAQLAKTTTKDLPALYGFGSAWATWVQMNASDWNAIADLPKVQALMERVVALDDSYEQGGAHLFLGVLYTLRPASLGGKPDVGRMHFEKAVAQSDGRNLMAKVLFARQYARLVFDQELHDQLLVEVVEADPVERGFTLSNSMAQEMAEELLVESEEYF